MRFIIPQFIEVEDKIIGPFTFKQFMYLAGGFGLAFSAYKLLPLAFAIPIAIVLVTLSLALTFYKINGKPFVLVLYAFITFTIQSKLYIWKKETPKKSEKKEEVASPEIPTTTIPKLTESRLSDLSWSLDILDMGEKDE